MMYEGQDNPLLLSVLMQSTARCPFKLHLFPWDTQHCFLRISFKGIGADYELGKKSKIERLNNLELEGYSVENLTMKRKGRHVRISFVLQRVPTQYLWDSYLPSLLLLAIGYGTLFLPVEPFNDRGTISLTTLLVLVALYTDSASSLPSISYNSHIDIWYIFSMVFLALIVATHLLTSASRMVPSGDPVKFDAHVNAWLPNVAIADANSFPKTSKTLLYSRALYACAFVAFLIYYIYWIIVH